LRDAVSEQPHDSVNVVVGCRSNEENTDLDSSSGLANDCVSAAAAQNHIPADDCSRLLGGEAKRKIGA